jgi:hypothetical protein
MSLKFKLLIVTVLVTTIFGIFTIPGEKFTRIFYDDTFYYISMVNNGSIFSPSVGDNIPTTGYHPLWYWLLEIMSIFTGGTITLLQVYLFCMVLFIGSFYIWGITLSRIFENEKYGFIASFIAHFIPTMFLIMLSGMETGLTIGLLGLFTLAFIKYTSEGTIKNAGWLAITTALVLLSRTDMALLVIPFFVWLFFVEKPYANGWSKLNLTWLAGCILPIPLTLIFFKLTGGMWFQTSAFIYPDIRWEEVISFQTFILKFGESFDYFNSFILYAGGFSAVLLVMLGMCLNRFNRVMLLLLIGLIIHAFFHVLLRFHFATWYLAQYCLIFGYIIVLLYTSLSSRGKRVLMVTLIGMLTLSLLWVVPTGQTNHVYNPAFNSWDASDRSLDQIKAVKLLDEKEYPLDWKIGAFNSGEFSYLDNGKHHIVNLDGLMNTDIARLYQMHNKDSVYAYFARNNINVLIDKDVYFGMFSRYIPLDSFIIYGGEIKDSSNLEQTTQKTVMLIRRAILHANKTVPPTVPREGEVPQTK